MWSFDFLHLRQKVEILKRGLEVFCCFRLIGRSLVGGTDGQGKMPAISDAMLLQDL